MPLQGAGEFVAGELAALIGIEDLGSALPSERLLERLDTELGAERIGHRVEWRRRYDEMCERETPLHPDAGGGEVIHINGPQYRLTHAVGSAEWLNSNGRTAMLDPLQQAFETEMKAKATARPRPAATRRASTKRADIDNSSAPGAAGAGKAHQGFLADAGFDITVEVIRVGGPHDSPVWGLRRHDRRLTGRHGRPRWRRTVTTSR